MLQLFVDRIGNLQAPYLVTKNYLQTGIDFPSEKAHTKRCACISALMSTMLTGRASCRPLTRVRLNKRTSSEMHAYLQQTARRQRALEAWNLLTSEPSMQIGECQSRSTSWKRNIWRTKPPPSCPKICRCSQRPGRGKVCSSARSCLH